MPYQQTLGINLVQAGGDDGFSGCDFLIVHHIMKVAQALPENMLFTEHGWEQYQYKGMTHYNFVSAELINPLELVGGYGHIKYASGGYNPNRIFHETTVDVEKA